MNFQKAIDIIRSNIKGVQHIYIFGSYAQKNNIEDSDLDLAFYSTENSEPLVVYNTAQEIAASYNLDVDLIDLHKAGDVLKMEIIYKGISIFTKSVDEQKLLECRILEDYMDYKELFQNLEEDIKNSGKILQ